MHILGVGDVQIAKGVVKDKVRWMGSDSDGMDSCMPIQLYDESFLRSRTYSIALNAGGES